MDLLQRMGIKKIESIEAINEGRQAFFLLKLAVLVKEGFSLKEGLNFLLLVMQKEHFWIKEMLLRLEIGQEFYQIVAEVGFSKQISSQIYLAQIHGQFSLTLENSGHYLEEKIRQKRKLKQLLHYPLVLLLFMFGILIAMRLLLLPYFSQMIQGDGANSSLLSQLSIGFVYYFPYLLVGLGGVIVGGKVCFQRRLKSYSAIAKVEFLLKFAFLHKIIRLYYTYYFSLEWAQLFRSGHQMLRIIQLMKAEETTKLMQEVALKMEEGLKNGEELNKIMSQFKFFTTELGAIVFHGELTSQLASELTLYGKTCQTEFIAKIEKAMSWIQPLIFILVAFFILCMYLALLLPMFTMMEGIG